MKGSFLRREWGAVTFVLTVLLGVVIVPVALYFGNQSPTAAAPLVPSPTPAVSASPGPVSSPSPAPAPTAASGPRQVSPSP